MKSLLPSLLLTTLAVAQGAAVTTVADAGAGSLRAAWIAANASPAPTFTIDVTAAATAAPIVLATPLPPLTRSDVTIRTLAGADRLIVDARGPTAGGGHGLDLAGARTRLLAPCRVLVLQGNGVLVRGAAVQIADLETVGNPIGSGLVTLPGADDLTLTRFTASNFQIGLFLQDCSRARVADDGLAQIEVRDCAGPGIRITNGVDHRIGTFVCTDDELGVMATNCSNLRLGSASGPRSLVAASRQQGVLLLQCTDTSLVEADLIGNGIGPGGSGMQVVGGARITIERVRSDSNVFGGFVLGGGVAHVRVGPGVTTRGLAGPADAGISLRDARSVTVTGATFGPDHAIGVQLVPEAGATPVNVTVCNCLVIGNRSRGMAISNSIDTLLCSTTVAGNIDTGIEAVGASLATAPRRLAVANCNIVANAGNGLVAQNVDGIRLGPGNRVDDNLLGGLRLYLCVRPVIDDAPSIARNRGGGVWLFDCVDAAVRRATLRSNRGAGIHALRSTNAAIGPLVVVDDTLGSGIQLEQCDGCSIFSSRITASSAHGVHVFQSLGTPGTNPHVLRSCLIADHPGLALYHAAGPPVTCELSTIAGNLRGIDSGTNAMLVDSCVVYDNVLEDVHQIATALTVRHTFHRLPAPAAGSSNTNADPQFVSPAARDWRLQPTSPAVGFADPALSATVGPLDAFAGPRVVGALDAGAHEVGPPPAPPVRLTLSSATMPRGGGGLAFRAEYPGAAAGSLSILLLEFGPASGSFPIFGGTIPLAPTASLLLAANDRDSFGTVAAVHADGTATGALLWAGRLSPSIQNQVVSLCAVALDPTLFVRAVSDVATFTIL